MRGAVPPSVDKAMQKLKNRIFLLVGRAVLHAVAQGGGRQMIQFTALKGEIKDGVERMQQYGFNSEPLAGASVLFASISGNRDHPIAFAVDDPRFRPTDWEPGDSGLFNDAGTIIRIKGDEILIKAATKIRIETPRLEVTGDIIDQVDGDGQSMRSMRETYNIHVHPENDSGGPTDQPNQQMDGE